jgi:tRNA uridine 5-carboxymethylaminomethyl modification enzyme
MSQPQLPAEIRQRFSEELWESAEIEFKYAGYVSRQNAAVEKQRGHEQKRIPPGFDYSRVIGLRTESRQKLSKVRPERSGRRRESVE